MSMSIPLTASNGLHLNHAGLLMQQNITRDREQVSQLAMRMEKRIMKKIRKECKIIKVNLRLKGLRDSPQLIRYNK
jgi:hypothetical protein